LLEFHQDFAWVVVIVNGLAGAWVLGANWISRVRHVSMWWIVGAAHVLMMVQVVIGVIVQNTTELVAPDFHLLYGFLTLISIGILYSYRQQIDGHLYLLYGLGTIWVMGLGLRAMFLGI